MNPDIYISKYSLDVFPLFDLLQSKNLEINNYKDDLLQIDAEGYDDEVIYNSNIDFLNLNILILSTKI